MYQRASEGNGVRNETKRDKVQLTEPSPLNERSTEGRSGGDGGVMKGESSVGAIILDSGFDFVRVGVEADGPVGVAF